MTRKSLISGSSLALSLSLGVLSLGAVLAQADSSTNASPAWAQPAAMALQKIGPVSEADLDQASFVDNLDCIRAEYLISDSGTSRTGCYMGTAFGQVDVENDLTTFAGTASKAIPLVPYIANEALLPWPHTTAMLALNNSAASGSYLSLYRDILGDLKDQDDTAGQLHAKLVTRPPDQPLTGPGGQDIVVNGNVIGYSDDGSWLVVETMSGSFVRLNLATQAVTPFAASFVSQGSSPGLNESQVAISDDGRYIAVANSAANSLKIYDLTTCPGPAVSLQPLACAAYNYWPYANSRISGLQQIKHLRFMTDSLLSFEAAGPSATNTYELTPAAVITSLSDFLSLGDSYTSGEGAYDYLAGTDTSDNVCHLSANSYPLLLIRQLFTSQGGHSVACSGATVQDILPAAAASYPGQVRGGTALSQRSSDNIAQILGNFSPGYLPQANFVSQYQPKTLTVSVGGNDIGFGDILAQCVLPHLRNTTCYSTYEDRLELARTIDKENAALKGLLQKLKAKSPATAIYVIGYPQIAAEHGDCALNVHLDEAEIVFSEQIVQHLDEAIAQAAQSAGAQYVDISQALAGHRLCETAASQVAVNGLTAGAAAGITIDGVSSIKFLAKESYHPNAFGYQLIEQAILNQTHNFSQAPAPGSFMANYTPAADDAIGLLNATKSGRAVTDVTTDDTITADILSRNTGFNLSINGTTDGLEPNTPYTTRLGGSDGQIISTLVTGSDDTLAGTVPMPGSAPTGVQTIDIVGQNQAGDTSDITKTVYVPVSSNDYDGDGIPNQADSCPTITNSGQDADHDGIDDACDQLIGAPSATGSDNSDGNNQSAPASGTTDTGGTGASTNPSGTGSPQIAGSGSLGEVNGILSSAPDPDSEVGMGIPASDVVASFEVGDGSFSDVSVPIDGPPNRQILSNNLRLVAVHTAQKASRAVVGLVTAHKAAKSPHAATVFDIYWIPWSGLFILTLLLLMLVHRLLERHQERIKRGKGKRHRPGRKAFDKPVIVPTINP
jgi:lysophospholipase L1-like esterase